MTGIAKIGPDIHPYRSLSDVARKTNLDKEPVYGGTQQIFYARESDPAKVPCPFAEREGKKVFGNTVPLVSIHLLVEHPDGRIKGDLSSGTAHKRYEFACCAHLPVSERIDLFNRKRAGSYTNDHDSATCFYCNFTEEINIDYDPEKEKVKEPKTAPVVVG